MKDKAYIVANKQQELEVLKIFEEKGFPWNACESAMSFVPSERFNFNESNFPYMLMITNDNVWWSVIKETENQTIVYDGRKEEKMYKVTQEFMNELIEWRDSKDIKPEMGKLSSYVDDFEISNLPFAVRHWWQDIDYPFVNNHRLIAIIQWLNGEDVFEVEAPHKFVVRNDTYDDRGDYWYVKNTKGMSYIVFYISQATKFDTREEAQEWANSHQVVVEIGEDGNEVE